MPLPILIAGRWQPSRSSGVFRAEDPTKAKLLAEEYPISTWDDCEAALQAATKAYRVGILNSNKSQRRLHTTIQFKMV